MRRRAALVLALVLAAGCAASTRLLVAPGEEGFDAKSPFAPRPGSNDVAIAIGGADLIGVDRRAGYVDALLRSGTSGIVDVAFRSEDELLVLRRTGVAHYFAASLFDSWPLEVSEDAHLAAGDDAVFVATTTEGGGRLLRLDEASNAFTTVLELDRPIAALAIAPEGCYLAAGDSVYRLRLDAAGSASLVFVLAIPDASVVSIAADPSSRTLYASTAADVFFYREGRVRPFFPVGGRIHFEGGSLFVSAPEGLIELRRASRRASALARE